MSDDEAVPNTFLDATAFVVAHQNRDSATCQRLMDTNDPGALITVLAQMLATAVRTDFAMTIEQWADFQAGTTLDAIRTDTAAGLRDDEGWE
jgi:hypothetical protein